IFVTKVSFAAGSAAGFGSSAGISSAARMGAKNEAVSTPTTPTVAKNTVVSFTFVRNIMCNTSFMRTAAGVVTVFPAATRKASWIVEIRKEAGTQAEAVSSDSAADSIAAEIAR